MMGLRIVLAAIVALLLGGVASGLVAGGCLSPAEYVRSENHAALDRHLDGEMPWDQFSHFIAETEAREWRLERMEK